ncbi:hypothetical protein AZ045_003882, partial [Enterobacter hormaechei]
MNCINDCGTIIMLNLAMLRHSDPKIII